MIICNLSSLVELYQAAAATDAAFIARVVRALGALCGMRDTPLCVNTYHRPIYWYWLVAGCAAVMGMHAQHWPVAILRRVLVKVPVIWRQARDKPMTWQRGQCLRGRMRIVQTRQWPACWVVAVVPQGGHHGL